MPLNPLRTFALLLGLAAAGLFPSAASRAVAQTALDGFQYNGLVYTSYQASQYSSPQAPAGAAALRATGAAYSAVLATQYVQTYTGTTIAPETTASPGYVSSVDPVSPTDDAVVSAIANLQAQGLVVVMKPQVDSLDGIFRGLLAPPDPAAFFSSYTTFLLHYAQLASSHGVGMLVIGTELKSLSGLAYRPYWVALIQQLRTSYPGLQLLYAANATGAGDEFTTVSFWDLVDIVGVDGYFPLTAQADPTVAQLVAAWSGNRYGFNALAALKGLQAQYNKPLIFTELGYVSASGTNEAPYNNAASGAPYDPAEQQNCYEAFFEVFSQQASWMKGVFWWDWTVTTPAPGDTSYSPQGKPASTVTLAKWFGSPVPAFTLAASAPLVSVLQGQSASSTLAVTALGGFAATPALTVTGLPAGVSGTFSPGSASGTQLLTLVASGSASPGPATLLVTGTAGTLAASATVQLTVVALPAQTISFANPGPQVAGTSVTLSASSSSGLAVSLASSTPAVCTLSGSTASLLASGTCSVTATQGGSSAFSAAAPVTQSFSVAPQPALGLMPATGSLILSAGATATDSFAVQSLNGLGGTVTLSAVLTAQPSGAQNPPVLSFGNSASFSIVPGTTDTATLTVATTAPTVAQDRTTSGLPLLFAALLLPFSLSRRRRRNLLLLVPMLLAALTLPGCGGAGATQAAVPTGGTTKGAYTVTVTASSGTASVSSPLTLTVQ